MADLDARIREVVGELVKSAPPAPPAPPLAAPNRAPQPHRGARAAMAALAVAAATGLVFISVHMTRHSSTGVKVGPTGPAGGRLTGSFPPASPLTVVQRGTYEGKPWDLQVEVNGPGPVFRQSDDPTKSYMPRMQLPGLCLGVNSGGVTDSVCTNPVTDPALTWMTEWAPFRGQPQTEVLYGLAPENVSAVQVHLPDQVMTAQTVSDAHIPGVRFFATFFPMQKSVAVDALDRRGRVVSTSGTPFHLRGALQVALSNRLDPIWPLAQTKGFSTPQAALRDFSTTVLGINGNVITLHRILDPYYGSAGSYTAKIAIPESGSQLSADVIPTADGSWHIISVNALTEIQVSDHLYELPTVATNLDSATGKVDLTFRVVPDADKAEITYNTSHGVVSRPLTAAELHTGYTTSPGEPVGVILLVFRDSQGHTITAYGTNGGSATIDPTQGAFIGGP